MSNSIPENRINTQAAQMPAGSVQDTPVNNQQPAQELLFGAVNGAVDVAATAQVQGMDTFTANSGAKAEELTAQKQTVDANNGQLREDATVTQDNIDKCETTINAQEGFVDELKTANEDLEAINTELTNQINEANARISEISGRLGEISSRIREIDSLISQYSGFVGGLINGFNGLIGKGSVNINDLQAEKATLQTERENLKAEQKGLYESNTEKRAQLRANGIAISDNDDAIAVVEENKEENEDIKAKQEAALKEIQELYKEGKITSAQLSEMIEQAYIAVAEEEARKQAEAAEGEADATSNETTPVAKPSEEQIAGTTAIVSDLLTNGDITVDAMEGVQEGIAAQDTTTGEFNAEAFQPAYEEAGFRPEEAAKRLGVIEALVAYEDIGLNLGIDIDTFQELSAIKLDEIIESAMVQDTIKATSTMVISKGASFTSKKDMQKNAESVDNFIDTYSALNSYYQANNVENLEVKAFLNLSSDKLNKINQGYVYGTAELQELASNAGAMMTTLRTAVSIEEAAGKSASIQFEENKHKADDAINQAEGKLGENEDTTSIDEFRTEFLNLTSKYNNSETDNAKQVAIRAMEALYERALNADQGVNKDPYKKEINIAA